MALRFPVEMVRGILDRFPRRGDPLEAQARERLAALQPREADAIWEELCLRVLLSPVYLGALWPEACSQHPELQKLTRGLLEQIWVPDLLEQSEQTSAQWVLEQGDVDESGTLMQVLLEQLRTGNPAGDGSFGFLARYYTWRDLLVSQLAAPQHAAHRVITRALGGGVKWNRSSGRFGLRSRSESVNSRMDPFSSVSSKRRTSESSASIHTFSWR